MCDETHRSCLRNAPARRIETGTNFRYRRTSARIAGDTKGNRVDPMLVLANEALEGAIQIAREEARELVVHRPVQHG